MGRNATGPAFTVLSDGELKRIHAVTLDVMERAGAVFQHPKALEILHGAGCKVGPGNRVRIPGAVVEQALARTPKSVPVYSRNGARRMDLSGRNSYFGAGLTCPFLVEPDGSRHPYSSANCERNTRVAQELEHIDFTMTMAHVQDVPAEVRDVHELAIVLRNSDKPVIITSHTRESLDVIVDMCAAISGSRQAFLAKPYIMYYTEPVSPLQHTNHSLEKLFAAVELGLPLLNTPAPMAGGTAPITLCGTLICGLAELLSGLVLIQHIRKGAPVILGGVLTTLDMRDIIFTYGSPELQLLNTAMAQMAQHYRVPSFGTAGASDAHVLDEQAAAECAFGMLLNAASGSNLIHDVGWLGSASATSDELLVLCDELAGYVRRCMRGVDTGVLEKSVEELVEVGPGGNFLEREMTARLFRREAWFPSLFRRAPFSRWIKEGSPKLRDRLASRVRDIAGRGNMCPLADAVSLDIDRILNEYDRRQGRQS